MKTRILTFLCFCFFTSAFAQVDLKINPIGALFGNPDVSADFALSDKFSVEGGLGLNLGSFSIGELSYKRSGFGAFAAGKTYFNPEDGADKFGLGVYSKFRSIKSKVDGTDSSTDNYTRNRFAVGLLCGWKWVSDKNILFEIDLGAGRAFVDNIEFDNASSTSVEVDDIPALSVDLLVRFAVGYRFNK